jgi:hypothetical protein
MSVALIQMIMQLVAAGIAIAPSIIEAAKTELDLLKAGAPPPTVAQMTQIDQALEDANDALQNAQPAP